MHPDGRSSRTATLIGLGAILLWATLAPLSLLGRGLPPFLLTGSAFLVGGLVGIVAQLLRRRPLAACFVASWPAWAIGVGGFFGYHLVYFTALRRLPAVEALLIINLWPLLIVLLSTFATGERLLPRHLVGAVAGLAGATLLVLASPPATTVPRTGSGYLLAVAAAFIWSGYSVLNRKLAADTPTDAVTGFCLVTGALGLLAHALLEPGAEIDATGWLAVLLLGLGPVGLAFYLWDHGTKHGDLRVLGSAAYAAPLLGTVLLLLMGEGEPSLALALAAALIVGGAAWASTAPARRTPAAAT